MGSGAACSNEKMNKAKGKKSKHQEHGKGQVNERLMWCYGMMRFGCENGECVK